MTSLYPPPFDNDEDKADDRRFRRVRIILFMLTMAMLVFAFLTMWPDHAQAQTATSVGTYQEDNGAIKNRIGTSSRGAVIANPTDGSGTTSATPNTSQQVFAANANRSLLSCQNINATGVLRINIGSPATAGQSWELQPASTFTNPPGVILTGTVNVSGSVASMTFMCKQG